MFWWRSITHVGRFSLVARSLISSIGSDMYRVLSFPGSVTSTCATYVSLDSMRLEAYGPDASVKMNNLPRTRSSQSSTTVVTGSSLTLAYACCLKRVGIRGPWGLSPRFGHVVGVVEPVFARENFKKFRPHVGHGDRVLQFSLARRKRVRGRKNAPNKFNQVVSASGDFAPTIHPEFSFDSRYLFKQSLQCHAGLCGKWRMKTERRGGGKCIHPPRPPGLRGHTPRQPP